MTDAKARDGQLAELAQRLARLDPDKQRAFLKQLDARGVRAAMLPIARLGRERAPLSFAQSRFWFLWRMAPDSSAYNMPAAIRLRGTLDRPALQAAFDALVRRHETLRTVFAQANGPPEQIVGPPVSVVVRHESLSGPDPEAEVLVRARAEIDTPFNLETGPLLRVACLALAPDHHILLATMHHIVADGWSMEVIVEEFWRIYAEALGDRPSGLPDGAVHYADYATWQRLQVESAEGARQLAYWRQQIGDDAAPLQLPYDRIRLPEPDYRGACLAAMIDGELATSLREFARSHATTIFVVLLAAFKVLLHRYSGQTDIRVGVPMANRSRDETWGIVGPLINTVVLCSAVEGRDHAGEFIGRLHAATRAAQDHQDFPFERLVEALHPQRSLSEHPLFQVLFNHRQRRRGTPPDTRGLRVEPVEIDSGTAKLDLGLDTSEEPDGTIFAEFSYATSLFEADTIGRMAAHWVAILHAFVRDSAKAVGEIALVSDADAAAQSGPNVAVSGNASSETIPAMFSRAVALRPEAEALRCRDVSLSYGDLEERSNRLARHLIGCGLRRGDVAAVVMGRSVGLPVALLAVLKAGAAYLPLDPATPPARLAEALADADMRLVLTDAATEKTLRETTSALGVTVVVPDALDLSDRPGSDPGVALHPQDLAYVIRTSGSTRLPKGVAVAHGPFTMHCRATAPLYEMSERSRELLFLSFAFDGAHERLWTTLSVGGSVVLRDDVLWSPEQTLAEIERERVTNAGFPPSYLQEVASFAAWRGSAPPVELYSFGGEAMPRSGFARVARVLGARVLINGYGPTEAVVTPLAWKADAASTFPGPHAPIGRAVGARSAQVLDADLHPVPVGVTGELYIGGEGLARGYLNRPAPTAERFVPDPFGTPGSRLYRTGDLACRLADGTMLYRGRSDDQVKIRGHRVEPGEVEARLLGLPGVAQAAVVARPGPSGLRLVGYVVAEAEATAGTDAPPLDGALLRASLAGVLPDYMLPTHVLVLDRLPSTANGKLDRRALPAPETMGSEAGYIAPRSEAETVLCAIWARVLGLERVGVTDNFFEIGGDSIVSLQVVSRARQTGWRIEPRDLFRHQTLEDLAAIARREEIAPEASDDADRPLAGPGSLSGLSQSDLDGLGLDWGNVEDLYRLAPLQQGMLFHALEDGADGAGSSSPLYVNQLCVSVSALDAARLRSAWASVSGRHAILRSGFVWRAVPSGLPGGALQVVYRNLDLPFAQEDWRDRGWREGEEASALALLAATERASGFDLEAPPLQRVRLVRLADGADGLSRHRLIWTNHHILMDGWSSAQFLSEVMSRYRGAAPAAAGPGRYRDYIAWLGAREAAEAAAGLSEGTSAGFWRAALSGLETPSYLAEAFAGSEADPVDAASDPASGTTRSLSVHRDARASAHLRAFARSERVTLATLVQGAWALLLRRFTGQATICFGATVAGRPASLPGVEAMLGLFINTLPVVDAGRPDERVGDWLRGLQDKNLSLREHEQTPLHTIQRLAGRPGQALFDTLVVFENYPVDAALRAGRDRADGTSGTAGPGPRFSDVAVAERANYPLMLSVSSEAGLELALQAHAGRFSDDQLALIATSLAHLLDSLAQDAARPLGGIALPDAFADRREAERLAALRPLPPDRVADRIAAQVLARPDTTALVQGAVTWSYRELDDRAEALARHLQSIGIGRVGSETRVGLALGRAPALLVGLLAVLKAGGVYVPLDPEYPAERLAHMIADSGLALILVQHDEAAFAASGPPLLRLDTEGGIVGGDGDRESSAETAYAPTPAAGGDGALAYVIYTSGSTGLPKGVMVSHRALSNFLSAMAERPGMGPRDTVLALTSLSFDIAVLELLLPLSVGARIVLADRAASRDPEALCALAVRHAVGVIQATPSTWRMLALSGALARLPAACRRLSGGEALAPDLARLLAGPAGVDETGQQSPGAGQAWNLYGPTETTVWSACARLEPGEATPDPGLGQAVANTSLRVLDADLHTAPAGVTGELYIGGEGLARGYLNRPSLTSERFVPDPFGAPGARLYRTGDLACRLADGTLLYRGRSDDQVKIRGHRVEPGEVEARLLGLPGVAQAAVVARPGPSGLRLVGYVVPEAEAEAGTDAAAKAGTPSLDGASLRAALAEALPDHMLPAHVLVLERLPLTPNGKLDRRALPAPDNAGSEAGYVAPRSEAETALCAIWADILRRDRVGITDDFFESGGDSISSLQVVSRAREAGWRMSTRDLFRNPELAALAAAMVRLDESDRPASAAKLAFGALAGLSRADLDGLGLDAAAIDDVYPLSPMQQGMLFHAVARTIGADYVNQVSATVTGLDAARFRLAWEALTRRHAVLRTGFLWRNVEGPAQQYVVRDLPLPFVAEDWRGEAADVDRLAQAASDDHATGFDLSAPPLYRIRLIRLDDAEGQTRHRLIWTFHHILLDGWSSSQLVDELLRHYQGKPVGPEPTPYRDYIGWLAGRDMAAAERHWREQLARFEAPTRLGDAFGRKDASGPARHARCFTELDEATTERLRHFAASQSVTLNTLVQATWALLLQRFTGRASVTFGVSVAGRPAELAGSPDMVGLFINTLPITESRPQAMRIGDWLRAIQERNLDMREHEQTPLFSIQGWAGSAGQALFDSLLVFENYPLGRDLTQRDGLPITFADIDAVDVTNFPMDVSVTADRGLQVQYLYLLSHFDVAEAGRIRDTFEHILLLLAQDAGALLGRLDLATPEDRRYGAACNARAVPCAATPLVHEAIAEQARRRPDAVALVAGEQTLSFAELDSRAEHLAHRLVAAGVGLETLVGIVVERNASSLVAMLAVLKAGGGYVPLDPRNPLKRLAIMVRDAGIRLVVAGADAVALPAGLTILREGDDAGEDIAASPLPRVCESNLAYVIYTSGSTGEPKGVAVSHGPLAMHCRATGALYEIDERSCELHVLSLAFDGAHERWLTVLSHGAQLVLSDATLWAPQRICEVLRAQGATHCGMPPAYLRQLAEWVEETGDPPPVRLYSFGGEAMPKAGFKQVARVLHPKILINGYGPTETVVTPLVWKVPSSALCAAAYAPIGVPVGDRTAHILDTGLDLVPAGIAGELYIGGLGLARGYHGKAAATADRFVPDPFGAPGARLYRTGDLARWRADGTVEYLGRIDEQVKIRGFRIELGEVEARLRAQHAVRNAVVVAQEAPEGSRLIAYVAPRDPDAAPDDLAASVILGLKAVLPDYMVPARIVVLAQLPLTPTGKVDRNALPVPDWTSADYVAPETEAERALTRIWQEILRVERVGVTDNFFELGGNSLLCLQVVSRLRRETMIRSSIKLRDLMSRPTIRELLADEPAQAPSAPLLGESA